MTFDSISQAIRRGILLDVRFIVKPGSEHPDAQFGMLDYMELHSVDKNSTVKEVFTGGKKDAYAIYNYVAGLVSQLSEKFVIVVRKNERKQD